MAQRGIVTTQIQEKAKAFLGREIETRELRLYPYLDFTIKNSQKLNPNEIGGSERRILATLRKEGHIEGGATGLAMTREFYDYIQDILFMSYVS